MCVHIDSERLWERIWAFRLEDFLGWSAGVYGHTVACVECWNCSQSFVETHAGHWETGIGNRTGRC